MLAPEPDLWRDAPQVRRACRGTGQLKGRSFHAQTPPRKRNIMSAAPLDLVLVNPASRPRVYQSLGKHLAAIEPPVWVGLMAGFVRNRGYSVQIIDAEADEL